MELASFYSNDFPSEGNVDMEIVYWEMKWAAEYLLILTKHFSNVLQYFNTHTLLRIVCLLQFVHVARSI